MQNVVERSPGGGAGEVVQLGEAAGHRAEVGEAAEVAAVAAEVARHELVQEAALLHRHARRHQPPAHRPRPSVEAGET